jgi:hypothetical protein
MNLWYLLRDLYGIAYHKTVIYTVNGSRTINLTLNTSVLLMAEMLRRLGQDTSSEVSSREKYAQMGYNVSPRWILGKY